MNVLRAAQGVLMGVVLGLLVWGVILWVFL